MQLFHSIVLATASVVACSSYISVLAIPRNITVDDTGSAIIYSALWNDGSNCGGCAATPDLTKVNGGTWHDTTHQPGSNQVPFASLQFTGTAVYVFCIIAHSATSPDGTSDMVFFINGQQVGSFSLRPNGTNVYDYNVPVYTNTSIPSGTHTITLRSGVPGGPRSLVLLDYIVYTTEQVDESTSPFTSQSTSTSPPSSMFSLSTTPQSVSSSPLSSMSPSSTVSQSMSSTPSSSMSTSSSRTVVIAAVAPSMIALLIAAAAIFFFMRRRRPQERHDSPEGNFAKSPEGGQDTVSPTFPTSASAAELTAGGAVDSQPGDSRSTVTIDSPPALRRKLDPSTLASSEDNQNHAPFLTPTTPYDETPATRPPSGLRPLPTRPTSGQQADPVHVPRSHTSLSSDVPPAYDDISRNGAARP